MIRLFVAIPLPDTIRMQLAMLQSGLQGARWVKPENIHLTLRFIGDVPNDQAHDIDAALAGIKIPGFTLAFDGIGSFAWGSNPHALWVGVAKSEPLMRLQAKIETALVRTGLPPESRKFAPHATLARLKHAKPARIATWAEEHGAFRTPPFDVDRFILFSSFLASEGAIYTPQVEYPLEVVGSESASPP